MFVKKISFFILIIMLFFLNHSLFAQNQRPQKVYRIIYVTKSNNWYLNQAKLWQKEVMKNPKNPEAWRNYYLATRYSRPSKFTPKAFKEKNKKMERILHDMANTFPILTNIISLIITITLPTKKRASNFYRKLINYIRIG